MSKTKNERLPVFIIAGAQKSGTTTLHHFLDSHPQVYFPPSPQEIHFFDNEKTYSKGLDWYSHLFAEAGDQQIIGQTSPLYLYHPLAAERIKKHLPTVKIIVILRNPVDRAYSHYWNSVRYGYESLPFSQAIEMESKRLPISDQYRRNFSYVDRGLYTRQLECYRHHFTNGNLLVLTQDDLRLKTEIVLKMCSDFIGVDPVYFDNFKPLRSMHNTSRLPTCTTIQSLRPLAESINFTSCVRLLDKLNLRVRSYPQLDTDTRETLNRRFADEIIQLKSWLMINKGYDLKW